MVSVNDLRQDNFRIGTVGRPIPGVQVRIAEDGRWIEGPNVMQGLLQAS